jgi:predicted DNA-binding transcriptional regulator AlpA
MGGQQGREMTGMEREGEAKSAVTKLAVTVEEGADMLGISRALMYRLVGSGEIFSIKIEGARRISVWVLQERVKLRPSA